MTSQATIVLADVTDWSGFSRAIRTLRTEGVAPETVRWRVGDSGAADLFDLSTEPARDTSALPDAAALRLPKTFVEAAREVFLNADESRFALLHRMAARIADDPRAWDDPLHADRLVFDRLRREVRHEIHKMHAFVRFRQIVERPSDRGAASASLPSSSSSSDASASDAMNRPQDLASSGVVERSQGDPSSRLSGDAPGDAPMDSPNDSPNDSPRAPNAPTISAASASIRHVAWFEPTHHILEAAAPFFARRFATMRWAILTPRVCVEWNGEVLAFRAGASRERAPDADAGEALWLAYYRSIFNPARVKVAMMKKEMPVRFWKNLPEAAAIGSLLADAPGRRQRMIDADAEPRDRRRGRAAVGSPAATSFQPLSAALSATESAASGLDATAGEPARVPAAPDLGTLRRLATRCRDCPVADVATQTVFGEGDASARLMIVGEQPGDHEDLRGRPFQGPAGHLLHAAIDELGWDARALYLTNAVKHFHHELRGKRRLHKTPGQQEALACLHWLDAEIAALRPRAIVALGATAARSLLGGDVGVVANEGQWFERADGIPVLICLHPAAVLRADSARQPAMRASWLASLREAGRFVEPLPESTDLERP